MSVAAAASSAAAVAALLVATAAPEPAPVIQPEPFCAASMVDMGAYLVEGWGETVSIIEGPENDTRVLFVNAQRQTWSVVTRNDKGICIASQSPEPEGL